MSVYSDTRAEEEIDHANILLDALRHKGSFEYAVPVNWRKELIALLKHTTLSPSRAAAAAGVAWSYVLNYIDRTADTELQDYIRISRAALWEHRLENATPDDAKMHNLISLGFKTFTDHCREEGVKALDEVGLVELREARRQFALDMAVRDEADDLVIQKMKHEHEVEIHDATILNVSDKLVNDYDDDEEIKDVG